jgi:4'-phosphopantetheinyl transferase EntD
LVRNDATGRPWLEAVPAGWALSLSHSGAWVAAVLATSGRVGVDVELVRGKAQRLARKFLSDEEQASALMSGPSEAATHYTLLWSAKETLYKLAARRGLIFREHLRLESFEPHTQGEIPGALILNDIQTRHSICYCRPADGYVLTYCFETTA